ncbi:Tyrosine-protein kinase ITK/TSK [Leucoagaricus sp. SymC.cos]|nr:Tyrosine-protein kinase ITK/TSK [Leucoagaricus sp. SymC.cos]
MGRVCVKLVVRVIERECQAQLLMAFAREAILWAHMSHENVLPFYGVYAFTAPTQKICLVSPLMDNGSLHEYLKKNPATPRLPLVQDVVNGLLYLHQSKIVHGDLKAANVLVSDDGRALITDFGLSYIAMTTLMDSTKANTALTLNWTAPELICDETPTRPTKASDIWSFGCLCYEVFTGLFPYYQCKSSGQVVVALSRGQPPKRPPPEDLACDQLDDRIWELLGEACWKIEPQDRYECEALRDALIGNGVRQRRSKVGQWEGQKSAFWADMRSRSESRIDHGRVKSILNQVSPWCKSDRVPR